MAISAAEFRKLLQDVQSLTAASRAADNLDLGIRDKLQALLPQLEQAMSDGYEGAATAINDVNLYVRLINRKTQESAQSTPATAPEKAPEPDNTVTPGPVPVFKESELNKPRVIGDAPPSGKLANDAWYDAGYTAPDDAGNNTNSATSSKSQAAVAVETLPPIKPRDNVLDKFNSYTYSASVYLVSNAQYETLLHSKKKTIDGYHLLFQTGGAPVNRGGVRPPSPGAKDASASNAGVNASPPATNKQDAGRNPFFDNDFYIDSITLDTSPVGKGSGASHMTASLKFTVIEPMGITLIDRLYKAVANMGQTDASGTVNYTAAQYLMVIRFYGYDQNGNIVTVRSGIDPEGTTDKSAIIEKFIPFRIGAINWSVQTKLVSYEWDCVPQGLFVGGFTGRGEVPYDVQLVDSTVGGLLSGNATNGAATATTADPGKSTTASSSSSATEQERLREAQAAPGSGSSAPPKASAAPTNKQSKTQGLMGAMNDFQKELVQRGIYTYPDTYSIEFVGTGSIPASAIKDAKLQLPNSQVDKGRTAAGAPATTDAQGLDPAKTPLDMVSRSFSITAGQMITQAIDLAIRNSSYITEQALVIIKPDGTYEENPNARNKPVKWFSIAMSAVPNPPDKMDPKRNDYAYNIKYTVSPWTPANVISKYFPRSTFRGVHKSYPYWFTGQNTAVLEYQEQMNALYSLTVSGSDPSNSLASQSRAAYTSSMLDIVKYNYAPRSNQPSAGAVGKSNELGANLGEDLISPGDLAECKIKILGDPDWIQQGSLFREINSQALKSAESSGFNDDGSVGFDSSDILFEIVWQRPEDYDLETGLADPYARTSKGGGARRPLQSRVYYITKVVSEFRQGKFEQTLHGGLYLYPKPDGSNAINPSAAASSTANQTKETQERTGVDLSTAAGNAARSAFAAIDPRRALVTGSTNAGSTGLRGGASTASPRGAQSGETAGAKIAPSSDNGRFNGADASGGWYDDYPTSSVAAAGAPGAATSNGEVVGSSAGDAPPRLPSTVVSPEVTTAGNGEVGPNSTALPANQEIAQD